VRDPALLARTVLSDPRFRPHGVAPHHVQSPVERALEWLRTTWQHLIDNVARQVHVSRGTTNVAGEILLALLVIGVLAVIARLLLSISRESATAQTTLVLSTQAQNAAELFTEANSLAALKNYGKAAVTLYRAALALLSERGVIPESASSTVGDVQRALRRSDRDAYTGFVPIARRFSDAAYAEQVLDADAWRDALASYGKLEARDSRDA